MIALDDQCKKIMLFVVIDLTVSRRFLSHIFMHVKWFYNLETGLFSNLFLPVLKSLYFAKNLHKFSNICIKPLITLYFIIITHLIVHKNLKYNILSTFHSKYGN